MKHSVLTMMRSRAIVLGLISIAALGCKAKRDLFLQQIYICDPAKDGQDCGTDRSGQPMKCQSASQLGGETFCTERCASGAEDIGPLVAANACLSSGARVQTCHPHASATDPGQGCPSGLACYRTDLLRDEGICLNIQVCDSSADCHDPDRTRCIGDLVRARYPRAVIAADHFSCVQESCRTSITSCPSGESCLAALVPTDSLVPDICVPNCDPGGNCPPNFACSRKVSGPRAPQICIPGILGYRCTTTLDCMLGDCVDTSVGFRICAIPCASDDDCVSFDEPHGSFLCVRDAGGIGRHCITPGTFDGSPCGQSTDCSSGMACYSFDPYRPVPPLGACRVPCDAQQRCPPLGGIPHLCLQGGKGGCFPGRFGMPCLESSQCIPGFTCEDVPRDSYRADAVPGRICTLPCVTSSDCDANRLTDQDGYCHDGFCLLGEPLGGACELNEHCRTRNCQPGDSGAGVCIDEQPRGP